MIKIYRILFSCRNICEINKESHGNGEKCGNFSSKFTIIKHAGIKEWLINSCESIDKIGDKHLIKWGLIEEIPVKVKNPYK